MRCCKGTGAAFLICSSLGAVNFVCTWVIGSWNGEWLASEGVALYLHLCKYESAGRNTTKHDFFVRADFLLQQSTYIKTKLEPRNLAVSICIRTGAKLTSSCFRIKNPKWTKRTNTWLSWFLGMHDFGDAPVSSLRWRCLGASLDPLLACYFYVANPLIYLYRVMLLRPKLLSA